MNEVEYDSDQEYRYQIILVTKDNQNDQDEELIDGLESSKLSPVSPYKL